jgi:hypothetical protein
MEYVAPASFAYVPPPPASSVMPTRTGEKVMLNTQVGMPDNTAVEPLCGRRSKWKSMHRRLLAL